MKKMTYAEAIRDGIRVEMKRDPKVYLCGEDVGKFGGCFGVTAGLVDEFPGRVVDTPISETAIMGSAVGAAAAGLRPIAEIMFVDFMGVCMDELFNQAVKMRYMFGGKATVPMVIKTICRDVGCSPALAIHGSLVHPHPRSENRHAFHSRRCQGVDGCCRTGQQSGVVYRAQATLGLQRRCSRG